MNKSSLELINSSLNELLRKHELNIDYLQSLINYFHNQKELSKKELLEILSEEKLTDLVYLRAKSLVLKNYPKRQNDIEHNDVTIREKFIDYLISKAYEYAINQIAKGNLNEFLLEQLIRIDKGLQSTLTKKDVNKFYSWIKFIEKEFYDEINNQCLEK